MTTTARPIPDGRVASVEPTAPSFVPAQPGHRLDIWRLANGSRFRALLAAGDLLALTIATVQAALVIDPPLGKGSHSLIYGLPAAGVLLVYWSGGYRKRFRSSVLDDVGRVVGAVSVAAMLIVVASITIDIDARPGRVVALAWGFAVAYALAGRLLLTAMQRIGRRRYGAVEPAIIVGAGVIGSRIARRLEQNPDYGLQAAAYLDTEPRQDSHGELCTPVLGGPNQLGEAIERTGARHVIFAFGSDPDRDLLEVARRCQQFGVDVSVVPRFFELVCDRAPVEHLGGLPLMSVHRVNPTGWQFAIKHAIDRVAAAFLVVFLSPLLLGIAVAVRCSSPGPIIFRQRRVGRDGQVFDLLKFRSMRATYDAECMANSFYASRGTAPGGVEGVDRRTRIGCWLRKTSLDELPQLLNVLKGQMSLVGPRPERPDFVELFDQHVERYGDRRRVKAGITGWAQVHGLRGQTSLVDRVEWDNYYIENWSLGLDLKVLAMTVLELLSRREE